MNFTCVAFKSPGKTLVSFLEEVGFRLDRVHKEGGSLYVYCYKTPKGYFYVVSNNAYTYLSGKWVYHCENRDLFKAIVSLREDTDMYQYFTDGKIWVKSGFDKFKNPGALVFHKASIEELVEHFLH